MISDFLCVSGFNWLAVVLLAGSIFNNVADRINIDTG